MPRLLASTAMEWRERDGVKWLEAELPGARAAFSARVGGVSEPPYDSLNIAIKTGDEHGRVVDNRRRLVAALGLAPENVLMGHQVHGADLLRHDEAQRPRVYADVVPSPDDVDAHATNGPGLAPLVVTADCLPVALSGDGGVAMAHAGWRGLTGGMLDLAAVAGRLLERAGVELVEASDLGTSCNPEQFFSHRRDGARTGRQCGIAWLERNAGGEAAGGGGDGRSAAPRAGS